MIGRNCWFVRSFAHGVLCDFSFLENYKAHFHEIWHRRSTSVPKFTIDFYKVKVKVQGQNRRAENLPIVIARLWFKISSLNVAIWQE